MSSSQRFLFIFLLSPFFSFIAFAQTFSSSNLPLVVINTNGQTINDSPKITADLGIIWNGPGKRNALTDPLNNYNGKIGIEVRGSSSQMFPKKSYGFETKSDDLLSADDSLLGMPKENDWILYAPYTDKTMIRDVLTYTLDASLGHYSPRCRFVELFLNGRYDGVYVLMEKIKRDKNRVDIAKLTATDNSGEDLTGGYIIKIDKTTGAAYDGWTSDYFNTAGKTYYQYDYPKAPEITREQKTYIQTWVRNMETALYLGKYTGTGNYHEYLNDSSFIDFMIINELAKNVDGYRLSSYLYKGKNKLMNCGPIWDFNLGYGNADYADAWYTSGFEYQVNLGSDNWQIPFWWNKLMQDQAYVKKLINRWIELRVKELSNQRITFVTDSLTNLISEAQERNYMRWPIMGVKVWPNYYVGSNYNMEVNWMKDWIDKRLTFIDQWWSSDYFGNGDTIVDKPISVYPNPFTDLLNIQLAPTEFGDATAELYSTSGVLIRKINITIKNGQTKLEFSAINKLNPGMYVLRITSYGQILMTEKVMKMP
jgi:hypothetical protein